MESVLQRLGFLVDTSGLMRGQAAMDSAAAAGVRLGAAADLASLRLSSMGRGPASANLSNVATQMERASVATRGFNQNAEQVSTRMTMLGTAAGTVAGIIAFQLVASIASVASELASIPLESARATDALTRFSSQLSFAFRGSAESVRMANADIIQLARDAGVSLSQIRNDYADIAISGRAAGLTRSGVTGVTGAFAQLGQLTGADPGALSRSMYQYQQMLNMGTVRWSDYRLADLNLPAFGDAVAAGETVRQGRDVSSAELIGMISRGEMSAMRLTEDLAEGVPKLLEEAGGQLPQLMSRSQAAMETEWTLLLEEMGRAWETSKFIQSLQYGVSDLISGVRGFGEVGSFMGMTPEERRRAARDEVATGVLTAEMARIDEANQARDARHRNAFGIVTNLDPIRAAQAQGRADIDLVQQALGDTAGLTNEQVAQLRRGLSLLEGQLARIESAVDRARRQGRESASDLAAYGAGGGYDLARSARGLVEQSINQLRPIGMDDAMGIVRGEMLTGAQNELGANVFSLEARRAELAAAGLGADGRRLVRLNNAEAAYRARFGNPDQMSADQRDRVDDLAVNNRGQMSEDLELDDRQRLADRARAESERLGAMREQLAVGIQLGQQGRIAAAQMQMERQLRAEVGDLLADELLPAERARVAAMVKVSEQLDIQRTQMAALEDAARTSGSLISDVLSASLAEGMETGRISGEAALEQLGRSAERIFNDIFQSWSAPFEKSITDWVSNAAGGLFGNRGGAANDNSAESVNALGSAAKAAAGALEGDMTSSAANAATAMIVQTKAADVETTTRGEAAISLGTFTVAIGAATLALENFTASMAADAVTDIITASANGNAFFGGRLVTAFARGGIVTRPTYFGFDGGIGLMGEAGDEAILPLRRGSDGKLGVANTGGGAAASPVIIQVIDQRSGGGKVETETSKNANGDQMIKMFVRDEVKSTLSSGAADSDMNARYGASRKIKAV